MPKTAQPWFWKGRGWYLETNRKRTFLSKDRAEAFRVYHRMMAGIDSPKETVAEIVSAFSTWADENRSPRTAKWYKDTLQSFLTFRPNLSVDELKPFHVQQWMDSTKVSSGTKRNYCRVMQRCMKWAEESGYIERSPIGHMRKPPAGIRDTVISEEEYKTILATATTIKPLIEFAYETGARAAEIIKLRKEHVNGTRVILPRSQEKMKRAPRIIYLSVKALELIKGCQGGYLFTNSHGEPWKIHAVNSAFYRMKKTLKKQYCLTMFRHTWANRMLTNGVDALTVATLMGHSDTSMVAKVYGHLNHATQHLSDAVEKAG